MTKELLFSVTKDDLIITTFKGSGPSGQHRNKTDSAVRIFHPESGAVGESQSERSQFTNKKIAFRHLLNSVKFKIWIARKTKESIEGVTLEEKVEKMMADNNLKVEVFKNNKWKESKL